MRLKNSSGLPDDLVREVINFVKPTGVSKFSIDVKKANWSSGRAWTRGKRVMIKLNPKTKFPHKYDVQKGKGYLPSIQFTMTELLVHLVAHELRHLWQETHKKGWRVWGSKGQFSERDADAYGIRMVRQWRRK